MFSFMNPKEPPEKKTFVAVHGGKPVGNLTYYEWKDRKARKNFLFSFVMVDGKVRRRGVAKKLMKKFITHLDKVGDREKRPVVFRVSSPIHPATLRLAVKAGMLVIPKTQVGSKHWQKIRKLAGLV